MLEADSDCTRFLFSHICTWSGIVKLLRQLLCIVHSTRFKLCVRTCCMKNLSNVLFTFFKFCWPLFICFLPTEVVSQFSLYISLMTSLKSSVLFGIAWDIRSQTTHLCMIGGKSSTKYTGVLQRYSYWQNGQKEFRGLKTAKRGCCYCHQGSLFQDWV